MTKLIGTNCLLEGKQIRFLPSLVLCFKMSFAEVMSFDVLPLSILFSILKMAYVYKLT